MINQLVSIIIPTYNRAAIISETLHSVKIQTYTNWECIIVDDGSADDVEEIVDRFIKEDQRFKFYKRPKQLLKGANSCRNYGFEISKGDYIIWFDDDDIMLPSKIEKQMNCIVQNQVSFCVDRYVNFIDKRDREKVYEFDSNCFNKITVTNYLKQEIFWGTINLLGERDLFNNVKYKDSLKSGQEYYFFISCLSKKREAKGFFLNEDLSLRRVHEKSIQQTQKLDSVQGFINKFNIFWLTYLDNVDVLYSEEKKYLLKKATLFNFKLIIKSVNIISNKAFFKHVNNELGVVKTKVISLFFYIFKITKKGDFIMKKLINELYR